MMAETKNNYELDKIDPSVDNQVRLYIAWQQPIGCPIDLVSP